MKLQKNKKKLLLLISLIAYLLALFFLLQDQPAWIINRGTILLTASFILFFSFFYQFNPRKKKRKINLSRRLPLLLLFFASLLLNTYKLNQISSGFHGDEAETALQAQKILERENNRLIDTSSWYHVPMPSFLPHTLTQAIAGNNIFGARLASAITGALALVIFYLFVKENFDPITALIASLFLLTSHWWLAFSRLAINYIQTPLFQLAVFLFLTRAFKNQRKLDFFLAGFFTGLSPALYFASRLVPILVIAWFLLWFKNDFKKWKGFFRQRLPAFLIGLLFFSLPLGFYYLKNPGTFNSRANNVFLFSPQVKIWLDDVYGTNQGPFFLILKQTQASFNFTKAGGDASGQYGYQGPILGAITLTATFTGLLICFLKRHRPIYPFLVFWLLITHLLGSILVVPPRFMPRLVGIIPLFFLLSALPLSSLTKTKRIPLKVSWAIISALLLIVGFKNLKIYFFDNPQKVVGHISNYAATRLAFFLEEQKESPNFIFLTQPYLYHNYSTLRFLAPSERKIIIPPNPEQYQPKELKEKTIFIIYHQYSTILKTIVKHYPQGKLASLKSPEGQTLIFVYQADPSED